MKKYFYLTLFFIITGYPAHAEVVRSFKSIVRLQNDSTLDVTETITHDFQDDERYGLHRFIDLINTYEGHPYTVKIHVLRVADGHGKRLKYSTDILQNRLKISLKDNGKLISGVHTYQIHYQVLNAVNFSGKSPRLYWNASGYQWIIPVQHVEVQFYPPSTTAMNQLTFKAFRGINDSLEPIAFQQKGESAILKADGLPRLYGISFAVDIPAGAIAKPTQQKVLLWILIGWWPAVLLPLLTFILLITLYWRGGRDASIGQARGVEWNPPADLTPAEFGTLLDEKCDTRDVIATLFDLTARGHLRIFEEKRRLPGKSESFVQDYVILRNATQPDALNAFEAKLLEVLFAYPNQPLLSRYRKTLAEMTANPDAGRSINQAIRLATLPETIGKDIRDAGDTVYQILAEKGYFRENPEDSRWKVLLAAGALGIMGALLWEHALPWSIGLLSSGILAYLSHRAMPAKTAKGVRKLRECQGFVRYVRMTEKTRWETLSQQDPQAFGKWLPYAMVLSVRNQWLTQFESLLLSSWSIDERLERETREILLTRDVLSNLDLHSNDINRLASQQ